MMRTKKQQIDYQFKNLPNLNNPILDFKMIRNGVIQVRNHDYVVGNLYLSKTGVLFEGNKRVIFNILKSFGVISELIFNDEIPIDLLLFKYKQKKYLTYREVFKKYGKKMEFDFGEKIFLPLKYFDDLDDPQYKLNFKEQKNEESL